MALEASASLSEAYSLIKTGRFSSILIYLNSNQRWLPSNSVAW